MSDAPNLSKRYRTWHTGESLCNKIVLPGLENDGLYIKTNKQLRFFSADVCESFLLCCLEDRLWNSLPVFETSLWAKSLSCSVCLASATPPPSWEFQNHSTFPFMLYFPSSLHSAPLWLERLPQFLSSNMKHGCLFKLPCTNFASKSWRIVEDLSCLHSKLSLQPLATLINSNNAVVDCTVEELNVDRTFTISSFHNYFSKKMVRH